MSFCLDTQKNRTMRGPGEICNGVEPHPSTNGGTEGNTFPHFQTEIMGKAASVLEKRNTDIGHKISNGKLDTDSVFAGRRDVRDPSTLQERQIVSPRGTVRGYRNRVRAGIATFLEPISDKRNFRLQEKGRIVIYTTSMCVLRDTWEKCKIVRNILQTHMVRYEERDLYMSRENQRELRERLCMDELSIPQVFADGIHLGNMQNIDFEWQHVFNSHNNLNIMREIYQIQKDADEFQKLNETGELRHIFLSFPKINVRSSCGKCGGYRYVPCSFCHGSKKSLHRNHFTEEFHALRCMQCDESGLQRCDMCLDQQE